MHMYIPAGPILGPDLGLVELIWCVLVAVEPIARIDLEPRMIIIQINVCTTFMFKVRTR